MENSFNELLQLAKSDFCCGNRVADCDGLYWMAKRHRLRLHVFAWLQTMGQGNVFCDVAADLQDERQRYECAKASLAKIVGCFNGRGISYAVIKGIALEKRIYGSKHLRDCGDIDLYVKAEDVLPAHFALIDLGYCQHDGMTSIGSGGRFSRAFVAACASSERSELFRSQRPLRRHPLKREYVPYSKIGFPTVEIHDGFYGFATDSSRRYLDDALAVVCAEGIPSFPEDVSFLLLLVNTYENSESFFSNNFDYGIVLRDYVDIRFFVRRHLSSLDWGEVESAIFRLGLARVVGVMAGNYETLFGDGVLSRALPRIVPAKSSWGVDIAKRMKSPEVAKAASLKAFRQTLCCASGFSEGAKGLDGSLVLSDSRSKCVLSVLSNSIHAVISTSGSFFESEENLFWICIYPLSGECDHLAFVVDAGVYGETLRVFAHWSHRICSGAAVKKKTDTELPFAVSRDEGHAVVEVDVARQLFGEVERSWPSGMVVCAGSFERQYGRVYWRVGDRGRPLFDDLDIGRPVLLSGVCEGGSVADEERV